MIHPITSAIEPIDLAKLFPAEQPLELELGCGDGSFTLRYALARETRFEFSGLGGMVLLFLFLAAFSFALGLQYARPTSNNLRQFMEMILSIALFFVVINVVRDEESLFLLARALIIGGAGAAFFGILFYVIPRDATVWVLDHLARFGYPGGYGALRFVEDDPNGVMRAIGTSIDPNVFGGLLIMVGVITLPQLASKEPLFPRKWVAVMVLLDITALFLTISRGSLVGFIIGFSAKLARVLTSDAKRRFGKLGYALSAMKLVSQSRSFSAEICAICRS